MHRKREFSYASAPERFRVTMRGAFPATLDTPAAMRALLFEIDNVADQKRTLEGKCAALVEIAADEKRDAEITLRSIV